MIYLYAQNYGKSSLHYAAEYGHKDIVLFLIDKHHIDIETRDEVLPVKAYIFLTST
jgi:ankyrin repeat protein